MRKNIIRLATTADAEALLSIYAPYIEQTAVTFEYEVPTVSEFAQRIEEVSAFYPYLIWEQDGVPRGYAYAHRLKERAAYQWNAELSIYLAQDACRMGMGTVLYQALIELLTLQHVKSFYGCVTMPNAASDRLHRKLGFSLAGIWPHSGYKTGKWRDVAWYVKTVAAGDPVNAAANPESADTAAKPASDELQAPPLALRSLHELPPEDIQAILDKYSNQSSHPGSAV